MTNQQKEELIHEGINYIKMMKRGSTIKDIAYQLEISIENIHECIDAARERLNESQKNPRTKLVDPTFNIHIDLNTGARQAIQEVEIELLRDIIIHHGTEKYGEFTTMLPVRIAYRRL